MPPDLHDERVWIVAPIGRDGALIESMLAQHGVQATSLRSLEEVVPMVRGSEAGALLLTEEALQSESAEKLLSALDEQPAWSDLPIVVLSAEGSLTHAVRAASSALEVRANVTLIERPVRSRTLARAAHGALRARRRQYQMREMLERERATRHHVEAASRAKDEFLATVSHELRTPLNAILGWAQLVAGGALDEVQRERAIATIERNAVAQSRLIEDLLDVGRIVSGNLRLARGSVALERVIAGVCEMLAPMAASRDVELAVHCAPDVGTIVGDGSRLQQIAWNLVSNAVKFSPIGGRVEITLRADGPDAVVFAVADGGVGIDPGFLPHVFERFRQADGSSTRSHGGLGLGLAIVRSLTELHGGTVSASSPGQGRGATFTVRLPRHSPGGPSEVHAEKERAQPVSSLRGTRVLVVDDDPDAREIATTVLANLDAVVDGAASADEALAFLSRTHPDVLICDIGMPERDGYSLMEAIRALPDEEGGNVPAIALTAYTRAVDRSHALAAGFDAHLTKPLDMGTLVRTVTGLAARGPQPRAA